MKFLADQGAASCDAVQAAYSGPEQSVWELVMGEQVDIGGASCTMDHGAGAEGWGGPRLCGVDSMIGVDLTAAVVETGKQRTAEEGLSDKITLINRNSLENGLGDASADFVYSKDAWCYMPDKQFIIDQTARIVKVGGTIMFTGWIEGEGLSDEEAQRFLGLMTFPAIPTVQEYARMLERAGCDVKVAESSGRYSLYMLKYQAVYDARKLLGWDEKAYEKLISDFEFMAKLAREGKIIQGMFVATKRA